MLIEHLPVKYELVAFKADRLRSIRSENTLLEDPVRALNGIANYSYYDELYFGRGQNIATGSPVVLHMANGTKIALQ